MSLINDVSNAFDGPGMSYYHAYMAYLWKHPKSKFYYARFRTVDGGYTNRSTKKTDRTEAKRVAQVYEDIGMRRVSEQQVRRTVLQLFEQVNGTRLESATVEEYLNRWLARKQVENAARTVEKYRGVVNMFLRRLGPLASRDISEITVANVAAFRDSVAHRGGRAATANVYLKTLRTAFQGAWREGLISENPAAKVETLRRTDSFERQPFTLDELRAIMGNAGTEWQTMIVCGLYTGARLSDIANLTWASVDLLRRELRFVTGKTGRRQRLPIAGPLLKKLMELPSQDNPQASLFPSAYGKTASRLSKEFNALLASTGLARRGPHEGSGRGREGRRDYNALSFHSLRHTATSLLKTAGVPEAVAREIIGHDTDAASRVYTHIDDEALRLALGKMPDVTIPLQRKPSTLRKRK